MGALDLAVLWEAVLARTLTSLRGAGVEPIVLKGLPLGQKLYGTLAARPSADLDLFIDLERRRAAHRALLDGGWHWRGGEAPFEGGYEAAHAGRNVLLEVHSALLDDALVRHLPFAAPGARAVRIGEIDTMAHDDDQLPAFLAVHLAKHAMPPLLWFVDFGELWEKLAPDDRQRAWVAARAARATRYLDWAVRRSALLIEAAEGSDGALTAIGFRNGERTDIHNALRVAALADSPRDAVAVVAGWAAPADLRANPARLLSRLAERLVKFLRGRLRAARTSLMASGGAASVSVDSSTRALTLGARDFGEIARDLAARDCAFWIRATGSSMYPAIPSGAAVRLAPVHGASITAGDVVLADLGGGKIVLHRVKHVRAGVVRLQGDANVRMDRPVMLSDVVAKADVVRLQGRVMPVPRLTTARAFVRAWTMRIGRSEGLARATARVWPMRGATHAK